MTEQQGVGPQTLRAILKDERVAVYQDPTNHLHIYYCGFYRCVLSFGFFRDAEISLFETDDYLELRSMGQGFLRFPLSHTLTVADQDEEWPDVIGG